MKERVLGHCFIGKFDTKRKGIDRILVWGVDNRMQRKVQLGPKRVLGREGTDGSKEKISDVRTMA